MEKFILKVERHIRPAFGILLVILGWFVLHLFRRELLATRIWLICEKRNEARDNGYHFYKYVREHHPEINCHYVIEQGAADYPKVACLGNVIYADSFKHILYYLAAERSISSQAYGAFPYGFNRKELKIVEKFCNAEQRVVHLRHGVQKDALAHSAFDYDKCNIDYLACSSKQEYEFIKNEYGYPEGTAGCVGLCRFDNLYAAGDKKEKIVLFMPTWRMWLKRRKDNVPLTEQEIENFYASEFYEQFSYMLGSEALLECLKEYGYKIYFYMHYQLQDYSELFRAFESEHVVIADRHHYDVQDLLMRASVLVTDFSSVQFDFAYMNKPLIYFQFDKDRFRSGHYKEGYFSYEDDGFGPCCMNAEDCVDELKQIIIGDAKQPAIYQARANDFFAVRDDKNCSRTFDAVMSL